MHTDGIVSAWRGPAAHVGADRPQGAAESNAASDNGTDARRVLAVRLGGRRDVLLARPAIRTLAAGSDRLSLLTSPAGADAAGRIPEVDEVLIYAAPWIAADAAPLDLGRLRFLQQQLTLHEFTDAVIFTSVRQSPLPMALLLRIAGVPRISAISGDYAGSLLNVRHRVDDDIPEPERSVSLAHAAGFELPCVSVK